MFTNSFHKQHVIIIYIQDVPVMINIKFRFPLDVAIGVITETEWLSHANYNTLFLIQNIYTYNEP